jgi:HK97 family phage major capsid protein
MKQSTPGQRDHAILLSRYGIDPREVGRIMNRAADVIDVDKLPMPTNNDELVEAIGDPRFASVVSQPLALHQFIAKYAEAQQGADTELRKTVTAETQAAMIAWLKENEVTGIQRLNLDPQNGPNRALTEAVTGYNPDAPGAALDNRFKSKADFFRSAWHLNRDPANLTKMSEIQNAYSSTVPADGGFLVPESMRASLLMAALEREIVRPRATVIPMETLRVSLPVVDSTTNVGSVFGGMIAYWTEEAATMTPTQAKFAKLMLEAKELTGYAVVPNSLLQDSIISFAAFIDRVWPMAMAHFADLAYMRGTGVGEPLGFIGATNPAAVSVAKETNQPALTIVWENIVKMFARLLPGSMSSAVWLVSPDTFPELATMALGVGTGGGPVWLNNGVGGPPATILGRPVVITEKANVLGTRGDIVLADLSYYYIGDRQMMSAASSEHVAFQSNSTAYRIIQRVDGRPGLLSAITPTNNGPALSAFVELDTRA